MKILERGTPPTPPIFRASCKNCKSKLEFNVAEEAVAKYDWGGIVWKVQRVEQVYGCRK